MSPLTRYDKRLSAIPRLISSPSIITATIAPLYVAGAVQGMNEPEVVQCQAKVFVYGSYRLGVHGSK